MDPAILMVCPGTVVASALKVTATLLAMAQLVAEVVALAWTELVRIVVGLGLLPPPPIEMSAQLR
jgi:hypothetical protein